MFFGGMPGGMPGGVRFVHMGGGMPGMGGMPFGMPPGMGGDDDDEEEAADSTEYYETLGVDKNASQSDIKKAYMKLARVAHPDKGGDPDHFKKIQEAYETLSDAEKREMYDRYGKAGAERGGGPGGMSPEDMLAAMFGGRVPQRQTGPRKSDDTQHKLTVSLEDCYQGKTTKIAINRTITSEDANGPLRDRSGKRYSRTTQREVIEVHVDKGARDGQKIVYEGKGDVEPGCLPGDLILVVDVKEHAVFKRKGADLIIKRDITLLESLTGVDFEITHLDGHKLRIKSGKGMVIKPEAVLQVPDAGMPVGGHAHVKGVLFVQFDVKFPDSLELTEGMVKVISGILPRPEGARPKDGSGAVVKSLEEPDMEARKARERLGKDAYDSDEDDGRGGPGVRCAQQ